MHHRDRDPLNRPSRSRPRPRPAGLEMKIRSPALLLIYNHFLAYFDVPFQHVGQKCRQLQHESFRQVRTTSSMPAIAAVEQTAIVPGVPERCRPLMRVPRQPLSSEIINQFTPIDIGVVAANLIHVNNQHLYTVARSPDTRDIDVLSVMCEFIHLLVHCRPRPNRAIVWCCTKRTCKLMHSCTTETMAISH